MISQMQRAVVWPVRACAIMDPTPVHVFEGRTRVTREGKQKKRGSRARRVVTKSRGDLAINTQLLLVKGERFQPQKRP